jgi:hypothetical protein
MSCAAVSSGLTSSAARRRLRTTKVAIRHAQGQACSILKCLTNSDDRFVSRDSILSLRPRPTVVALDELILQPTKFKFNAEATCYYLDQVDADAFADCVLSVVEELAVPHDVETETDAPSRCIEAVAAPCALAEEPAFPHYVDTVAPSTCIDVDAVCQRVCDGVRLHFHVWFDNHVSGEIRCGQLLRYEFIGDVCAHLRGACLRVHSRAHQFLLHEWFKKAFADNLAMSACTLSDRLSELITTAESQAHYHDTLTTFVNSLVDTSNVGTETRLDAVMVVASRVDTCLDELLDFISLESCCQLDELVCEAAKELEDELEVPPEDESASAYDNDFNDDGVQEHFPDASVVFVPDDLNTDNISVVSLASTLTTTSMILWTVWLIL